MILYHYTSEAGYRDILACKRLRPSLRASNPRDARHGDGQYLTDIMPGTKRPAQLSYIFLRIPYQGRRFTHYVGINTSDLRVVPGRQHVFVILNHGDLDISQRIVTHGRN